MTELQELLLDLQSPLVWRELGVLALCLLLAWGVSAILGRGARKSSVLFGHRVFDGLLFPALLWVLAYVGKVFLLKTQHVPVLKVVLPILASLVVIRLIARVLTAVFPSSPLARLTERGVSWLAWGVAVLWITGWGAPLVEELEAVHLTLGKSQISLRHVLDVSVLSALVLVLTLWLSATLEQRVLSRAVSDLSMRKIAANALRALLLLIGALFALSTLGVDLTALSVLGGALGVGLGFGLQKLAANYISGFVILIERSLRIGDYVRVDGFEGRVADIKTRYTLVRANNGSESIVPNELLMTQRVENLSLESPRFLLGVHFWLVHTADAARAQSVLVQAAQTVPRVLTDPAPVALLAEVTPQGLHLQLNFWIEDAATGQGLARSEVNLAAVRALREAGLALVHAPSEATPARPGAPSAP
jgi:small-conductance mechanosensitive channel